VIHAAKLTMQNSEKCCMIQSMDNRKVGRPKLNLVRFTVTTTPEVKAWLEDAARRNGRSLAVEAGRVLAASMGQESESLAASQREN
jgi:hypothetical protein